MLSILLIIIYSIIIIYLIYVRKKEGFLELIESNINNKKYGVQEKLSNYNQVPDKLAEIEEFINSMLLYLKNKYPNKDNVKRLVNRLNDIKIEESEFKKGISSFTVNKGELISVCVRNKDKIDEFHDNQLLQFVILHELAHISSSSYGHNNEFNENFKWLLKEAKNIGYIPINYSKNPVTYCGVDVTNNPIYE